MYIGLWSPVEGFRRDDLTPLLEEWAEVQATLMRVTIHLVSARDHWLLALAVRVARRTPPKPGGSASSKARSAGPSWTGWSPRGGPSAWGCGSTWRRPASADLPRDAATARLVRRYLTGFGPATTADGLQLDDLPGAPLPDADTPAPVRFLPTRDASLLVHARRKGILAEEHRPVIFNTKTPHSSPTFRVDATVAGTWRYEKGEVRVRPFEPLPGPVQAQVDEEASRLGAFHT